MLRILLQKACISQIYYANDRPLFPHPASFLRNALEFCECRRASGVIPSGHGTAAFPRPSPAENSGLCATSIPNRTFATPYVSRPFLSHARSGTRSRREEPVGETLDPDTVVRLEPERKIFTDLVRTLAYRAESALLGRVGPLLARDGEEGRAFLKALFATPADLVPNDTELLVRFHSMAQPRFNRALRALCEAANDDRQLYPGTSLRMVFEGPRCLIEN